MKQNMTPLIVQAEGQAVRLEKVSLKNAAYDEQWLQNLCYRNPTILPIYEIEPSFGGIVPVCRELSTASGACDLIYVNESGFITIGECKLWRNPEARRHVVGQILDYAKDLSQWDYTKFEQQCLKARKGSEASLYSILAKDFPDLDEADFVDRVQRNLRKGRFLLLIIGDGIQENMESLAQYIQGQGALNFSLSLLEIPIFKHPVTSDLVITPRLIARTKDIERTLIHIVERLSPSSGVELDPPPVITTTVSHKVCYERLSAARGKAIAERLMQFLNDLEKDCGIVSKVGRGKRLSLNIKSPDDTYNFGSVQETGEVWFYGIVTKTEQLGDEQIGIKYLEDLAKIMQADVDRSTKQWSWGIKRGGRFIMIDDYLAFGTEWRDLICSTLQKIQNKEQG
jgi:hypothetical protein